MTFGVSGSALYVFGIIPQNNPNPDSGAEYSFSIDGELVGQFSHDSASPPGSAPFLYNQILYFNDSIPSGKHTFILTNGQSRGNPSLILFDYLIYSMYVVSLLLHDFFWFNHLLSVSLLEITEILAIQLP